MKRMKSTLAMVLTLCLLLGMFPLTVLAAPDAGSSTLRYWVGLSVQLFCCPMILQKLRPHLRMEASIGM